MGNGLFPGWAKLGLDWGLGYSSAKFGSRTVYLTEQAPPALKGQGGQVQET